MSKRQALEEARAQGHDMLRVAGTYFEAGTVEYVCWKAGCRARLRIENNQAQPLHGWDKLCPHDGR